MPGGRMLSHHGRIDERKMGNLSLIQKRGRLILTGKC